MPFPASIALAVLKAKTEITENNKDDTDNTRYDYNYDIGRSSGIFVGFRRCMFAIMGCIN